MRRGDLLTIAASGEYGKPRPALIVQADLFLTTPASITVLLLTTTATDAPLLRVPIGPRAENGLRTRSYVQIDKALTVPVRKTGAVFGHLDDADMLRINRALALFLGIAS